ncbi:MAG: hypothetical protein H0T79_04310 [Deltaproteobacteria bacterium]|nr:hypothetical protein [Deltaproteobacteria bacterium]
MIAGPFGVLVIQSGLLLFGLHAIFKQTFAPRCAAWVTFGVFVFPPVMTPMAVIWKDCSMAGLLACAIALLLSDRRRLKLLGLLAVVGATAMRYNAFGATLPLVVLLFEWRPGMHWLPRYAIAIATWFGVTVAAFGVNAALTDKPMHYWHSSLALYDIVGTLAYVDDDLPDAQLREELAGTQLRIDTGIHQNIRAVYSPREFFPIINHPKYMMWDMPINGYEPAPQAQRDAIGRAFWNTITAHPWAYTKHRFTVLAAVLDLQTHRAGGAVVKRDPRNLGFSHEYGLSTGFSPLQLKLTKWLGFLARHTPIFTPWVYAVIAILLLPFALRYRDVLAILLSGLVMESSLLFLAHSVDYRYSHWMVISTIIGAVILIARRSRRTGRAPPE